MKPPKNPFKEIGNEPLPAHLKEKVMHSVEMSQLLIDVADLFVVKMGKTFSHLFRTNTDNPSNDSDA